MVVCQLQLVSCSCRRGLAAQEHFGPHSYRCYTFEVLFSSMSSTFKGLKMVHSNICRSTSSWRWFEPRWKYLVDRPSRPSRAKPTASNAVSGSPQCSATPTLQSGLPPFLHSAMRYRHSRATTQWSLKLNRSLADHICSSVWYRVRLQDPTVTCPNTRPRPKQPKKSSPRKKPKSKPKVQHSLSCVIVDYNYLLSMCLAWVTILVPVLVY